MSWRSDSEISDSLLLGCASRKCDFVTAASLRQQATNFKPRLVARLAEGRARQGLNAARLDASRLAGGIYFVKLQSADEDRTAKVIVE